MHTEDLDALGEDTEIIVPGHVPPLYVSSFHPSLDGTMAAVFVGTPGKPEQCIGHIFQHIYGDGWGDHDNPYRYQVGPSITEAAQTVYFWRWMDNEPRDRNLPPPPPDYWPLGFYPRPLDKAGEVR